MSDCKMFDPQHEINNISRTLQALIISSRDFSAQAKQYLLDMLNEEKPQPVFQSFGLPDLAQCSAPKVEQPVAAQPTKDEIKSLLQELIVEFLDSNKCSVVQAQIINKVFSDRDSGRALEDAIAEFALLVLRKWGGAA